MVKTVTILSLSRGLPGEDFARHELDLGLRRLREMGLTVKFGENARKGISYLQSRPEARANDLLAAFRDPETDMILCAIGGDDTYRLLPRLFDHDELRRVLCPKIFLGFSDTTANHFMLHKLGLPTFYGQSFLSDVCELEEHMLPYTEAYFRELIRTGSIREIRPSPVWYEERTDFGPDQLGVPRASHPNGGFRLLQGPAQFSGPILGGCIDTLYDFFHADRYPDIPELCGRYGLFPAAEDWKGRLLLLETSEEKPSPEKYRQALTDLKERGVLDSVAGILAGKPMDEAYAGEYQRILVETVDDPSLPILWDLNIGHATPRCIIPFGPTAHVDAEAQRITFESFPCQ